MNLSFQCYGYFYRQPKFYFLQEKFPSVTQFIISLLVVEQFPLILVPIGHSRWNELMYIKFLEIQDRVKHIDSNIFWKIPTST